MFPSLICYLLPFPSAAPMFDFAFGSEVVSGLRRPLSHGWQLDRFTPGKSDSQIKGSTACLKSTSAGDPLAIAAESPLIPTVLSAPGSPDAGPHSFRASTTAHNHSRGHYSPYLQYLRGNSDPGLVCSLD